MELLVLVLLIGIGPLAVLLGVDSREHDDRGWWPGAPRPRASRPGLGETGPGRLAGRSPAARPPAAGRRTPGRLAGRASR